MAEEFVDLSGFQVRIQGYRCWVLGLEEWICCMVLAGVHLGLSAAFSSLEPPCSFSQLASCTNN